MAGGHKIHRLPARSAKSASGGKSKDAKATLCKYWLKSRVCNDLPRCRFAHGNHELRVDRLCIHHEKGWCRDGEACRQLHDIRPLCKFHEKGGCRKDSSSCMFKHRVFCKYHDKGGCRDGDLCRFVHRDLPDTEAPKRKLARLVQTCKVFVPDRTVLGESRGNLLGPRGTMLKQLIAESGCQMVICGKGSSKVEDNTPAHLLEQLHVLVTYEGNSRMREKTLQNAEMLIRAVLMPITDTMPGQHAISQHDAMKQQLQAAHGVMPQQQHVRHLPHTELPYDEGAGPGCKTCRLVQIFRTEDDQQGQCTPVDLRQTLKTKADGGHTFNQVVLGELKEEDEEKEDEVQEGTLEMQCLRRQPAIALKLEETRATLLNLCQRRRARETGVDMERKRPRQGDSDRLAHSHSLGDSDRRGFGDRDRHRKRERERETEGEGGGETKGEPGRETETQTESRHAIETERARDGREREQRERHGAVLDIVLQTVPAAECFDVRDRDRKSDKHCQEKLKKCEQQDATEARGFWGGKGGTYPRDHILHGGGGGGGCRRKVAIGGLIEGIENMTGRVTLISPRDGETKSCIQVRGQDDEPLPPASPPGQKQPAEPAQLCVCKSGKLFKFCHDPVFKKREKERRREMEGEKRRTSRLDARSVGSANSTGGRANDAPLPAAEPLPPGSTVQRTQIREAELEAREAELAARERALQENEQKLQSSKALAAIYAQLARERTLSEERKAELEKQLELAKQEQFSTKRELEQLEKQVETLVRQVQKREEGIRQIHEAAISVVKVKREKICEGKQREGKLQQALRARKLQLDAASSTSGAQEQKIKELELKLSSCQQENECSICLERKPGVILQPCGHVFCCHSDCAPSIATTCPMCRKRITEKIIFFKP